MKLLISEHILVQHEADAFRHSRFKCCFLSWKKGFVYDILTIYRDGALFVRKENLT